MNQFSVILPSNASMNLYPENKTSSFKVNLPQTLELDSSKWEVELSEIQFEHSWYNIREGRNFIVKDIIAPTINELKKSEKTEKIRVMLDKKEDDVNLAYRNIITIPSGHYNSIKNILKAIHENDVTKFVRKVEYNFDELSKRTVITLPIKCRLDIKDSDIAKCLGFEKTLY